ncbi:hypothetical protein DERP_001818, partial [Dermatophagoides pteronyssinus]
FVVLVAVLGACFAEESMQERSKKMMSGQYYGMGSYGYGGRGFGSSDRSGLGYGYGGHHYGSGVYGYGARGFGSSDRSGYGYGLGGHYYGPAMYGYGVRSYGAGYGYGLGGNRMYYGRRYGGLGGYHGLGGNFGYSGILPSYSYGYGNAGYALQPITTAYIAQPVVQSMDNVRLGAAIPSVEFMSERRPESQSEVVKAAVYRVPNTVEYKSMPTNYNKVQPQVVEVEPSETALHLHFKTGSSGILLTQSHEKSQSPEVQVEESKEDVARLIHKIEKPIIQEVHEVITPYRQITKEISPVVEAIHTIVSKSEDQRQNYHVMEHPQTVSVHREQAQMAVAQPVSTVAVAQPVSTVAVAQPVAAVAVPQQVATVAVAQPIAAQPIAVGYEEKYIAPSSYGIMGSGYSAQPITYVQSSYEPAKLGYGYDASRYLSSSSSSSSSSAAPSQSSFGNRWEGDAGSFRANFDNRAGMVGNRQEQYHESRSSY